LTLLAAPRLRAADLPGVELQRRLGEVVTYGGFDDPKPTLADALVMIAKRYDLSFTINQRAFRDHRTNIEQVFVAEKTPVLPMKATLGTVLQMVLSQANNDVTEVTYVIRGGFVEVTTRVALIAEFYPGRGSDLLPPLVYVSLDKRPLDEALQALARRHDACILLDPRGGDAVRMPVTADLLNVPLDTAVRLLADMAGLEMVQVDRVLYVTTPENARLLREKEERRQRGQPPPGRPMPGGPTPRG
jgi:hypothetical protein